MPYVIQTRAMQDLLCRISEIESDNKSLRARAEKAEAESAGRLMVLEEKAEEARMVWWRAENAEAKCSDLRKKLDAAMDEVERLRKIEEAAKAWRDDIDDGGTLRFTDTESLRESYDAILCGELPK